MLFLEVEMRTRLVLAVVLVVMAIAGCAKKPLSVADLLAKPVYDKEVTVYGEVVQSMSCRGEVCGFVLSSGDEELIVLYQPTEITQDESGALRFVELAEIGDMVTVTGELQAGDGSFPGGSFWASSIERME
jgi:hypothetical protein